MKAIQTEKLTKYYGSARGIDGLDLCVEEGSFFGFIGPNGAGKSTTIRTLLGLIRPTSGRASVLGREILRDKKEILRRTGYLPAEAVFPAGMRVREVLRLSAGLRGEDCAAESEKLCERLQLDGARRVEDLSFGNRKKVGIVCALQHRPELLILDEPTSGLDPLMQREFFALLRERNQEGGTIFLSSHILSEIQHHCSRAAIIREGRLIAGGSVEELIRSAAKRIHVRGSFSPEGLSGARAVQQIGDSVSFLYTGAMDALIARLSEARIEDLSVTEPDLEEIFMHYYTEGGEQL